MDLERIAELLRPFLTAAELAAPAALSEEQLQNISIYIDLLARWNARVNLTAVRDAEEIVTRHFGESLFLAAYLFPRVIHDGQPPVNTVPEPALDLGSGAGFPGLPLKIYAPEISVTLVESNHKKAAFLNEAIRLLHLGNILVFAGRIEPRMIMEAQSGGCLPIEPPNLVTMRAVERFQSALRTAAALVRYGAARRGTGRLALLIGQGQVKSVSEAVCDFAWKSPVLVPRSQERVLVVGQYPGVHASKE